jgi:hypothetical protein
MTLLAPQIQLRWRHEPDPRKYKFALGTIVDADGNFDNGWLGMAKLDGDVLEAKMLPEEPPWETEKRVRAAVDDALADEIESMSSPSPICTTDSEDQRRWFDHRDVLSEKALHRFRLLRVLHTRDVVGGVGR